MFLGQPLGTKANGGYTVRRNGTAVSSGTCAGDVTGGASPLSCTDTNVPPGNYTYTVQPKLDDSWIGTVSPDSATAGVAPLAPATLTATAVSTTINLSWAASSGATSYNLYRATTSGGPYALRISQAGTTFADPGLTDGTTYFYVVRAVTAGNESPNSPQASATADSTAPTVAVIDPGTPLRGSVAVSATASDAGSGIASVKIQYSPAGAGIWTDVCTATSSPYSCSWNTTVPADGLYDLRAIATDNAGNTTTSATVTNLRVDNTAPATTLTNPGSPLRATVSLANTATDAGGSGISNVKLQRSPAGANTWTDICSTATATACSFDTTAVADGVYDLRVLATDVAGNTGNTVVANRTIDNTKPSGTDVQAVNKAGGTLGRAEAGDTVTYSFSEAMAPASFLTGWTGSSTNVTVHISNAASAVLQIWDSANSSQLPFGPVNLQSRFATLNLVFTNSTMVMSGNTIVVTLGALQIGGLQNTSTTPAAVTWNVSTTPTDIAGNSLNNTTVTESGTLDVDSKLGGAWPASGTSSSTRSSRSTPPGGGWTPRSARSTSASSSPRARTSPSSGCCARSRPSARAATPT